MKRLALVSAIAAVLVLGAAPGCGGAQGTSGFGQDSGTGSKDGTVDSTQPQTDGKVPILKYDGGGESGGCGDHCSADLHSVLDCHNNVITTCPASEGCGPGGMCVPACESAAANQSTVGCDYYSIVPAGGIGLADGSCFAAYIANTWNGPVSLSVEYNGMTIPIADLAVIPTGSGKSITYAPLPGGMLPEGELAILFLNDEPSEGGGFTAHCPAGVTAAVSGTPAFSDATAMMNGFHITSSAPVVAYDIFPYGGSTAYISSATLLVPTTAWGTNYVAVDAFLQSQVEPGASNPLMPFIQIAAVEDGTTVTLSPTVNIVGGTGVAPATMGTPTTYNLNAGQVVQFLQAEELNGTPIQSNKPIGVWGGANCMNINVTNDACDSGHQQLFPVSALGNEYVGVRYRPRDPAQPNEAPPWRIMGAVDGTVLTYDPPTPPTGAPSTLSSGQLVMFYSAGPFVVKSQDNKHPFYMSAHMGGQNFLGGNYLTGDPETVNVMPPAEYLESYIFMTDPTMSNTNLVLVRQSTTSGTFEDVSLDCITGPVPAWQPIGTSGTYEYAWVDLVSGGAAIGACNNGYHTIKSTAPFGLTVWGWDQYVSYAYPAGASVQPINTVVVLPTPK
jgi:hypothetical protein